MFKTRRSFECLQSLLNNPSGLSNWLPYKFKICNPELIPITLSFPERSITLTDDPFK